MEFNSSCDQTNFLGYHPPSQISNGGWGYHQQLTDSEQTNPWRLASETQDEQENHMGHFPETQYDPDSDESNNYSYCDWESQNQRNLSNPYCEEFNSSSNCDSEDLLQKSRGFFERQE
ncbi:hypothetical protein AHAS_Ahas04G0099100 [Arachis hypogaea]